AVEPRGQADRITADREQLRKCREAFGERMLDPADAGIADQERAKMRHVAPMADLEPVDDAHAAAPPQYFRRVPRIVRAISRPRRLPKLRSTLFVRASPKP